MSVVSEIERIKTNIANAYTELENKGATLPEVRNSENLSSAIIEVPTGSKVEKGFIPTAFDENGFATEVSVVGMTEIPRYAFYQSGASYPNFLTGNLTTVKLPNDLTVINSYAFRGCSKLVNINIPSTLTKINSYAFYGCGIGDVILPSGITTIYDYSFRGAGNMKKVICEGDINNIYSYAFQASGLTEFVLPNVTKVPTMSNANALSDTPIYRGEGSIYVPDDLVTAFKEDSVWSSYASKIKPLSEWTGEI